MYILSMCSGSHAQNFQPCEAPRPIRALNQGTGTGLPVLLLDSKNRRRHLRHPGEPIFALGPQIAIGSAGGNALSAAKGHQNSESTGDDDDATLHMRYERAYHPHWSVYWSGNFFKIVYTCTHPRVSEHAPSDVLRQCPALQQCALSIRA
jgi:hypothetical protein